MHQGISMTSVIPHLLLFLTAWCCKKNLSGVEHKRRVIRTKTKKFNHACLFISPNKKNSWVYFATCRSSKTICFVHVFQLAGCTSETNSKREWKQSTQSSLLGGTSIVLKCLRVERVTGCEHVRISKNAVIYYLFPYF